jgi:hypothetical protein
MHIIGTLLLVIWLIIGGVAASQRHYFSTNSADCASTSTLLVTIVAGPLNYVGVNPKVSCTAPQPSK